MNDPQVLARTDLPWETLANVVWNDYYGWVPKARDGEIDLKGAAIYLGGGVSVHLEQSDTGIVEIIERT